MRIFEFHFNHKKKRDSAFGTFIFEPSLCVAGELTNVMPQNNDFLETLALVIKNEFYAKSDFSEALKAANDFLDKESKSGNVNWLGNLNFAIISIRDSILNFTKVGSVKILLLKEGEILDISQNLELQDQEPYSLKVFGNIASGKLSAQDKILILTQEIFSAISKNEVFLNQLSGISKEKEIKNIFKLNKETFSKVSGICLFITEENRSLPASFRMPKRVILIVTLIFILTASFFLFRGQEPKQSQYSQLQEKIDKARSKIMMAENFIIIKKEEEARVLFQEAWNLLSQLQEPEAESLKESIKKYLK